MDPATHLRNEITYCTDRRKEVGIISVTYLKEYLAEIDRLRAALMFYADEKNWVRRSILDMEDGAFNGWGPAREALNQQITHKEG